MRIAPPSRRGTSRVGGAVLWMAIAGACSGQPVQPTAESVSPPAGDAQSLRAFDDQPWNTLSGGAWRYLRRTSARDADIVQDPRAPASAPNVLRLIFTPGMPRDTEPAVAWLRLPNPREVYAGWWIKLSANWIASPAGAAKMTFLHVQPDGQGQVYTALGGSRVPHSMVVNTEWSPYGQRFWEPNTTATPIAYDRWHRIEWYVKWESAPGAGDGVLRWWVDGVLNGDHQRVRFPDGAGFQQFEFAPTVQHSPPAEQYMYIDHATIRIGRTEVP